MLRAKSRRINANMKTARSPVADACDPVMQQHTNLLALPADLLRLVAAQYVGALERAALALSCSTLRCALKPLHSTRLCELPLQLYGTALSTNSTGTSMLCWLRDVMRVPLAAQDASLCAQAAQHGRLDALRWLHDTQHVRWDESVCAFAAERGDLVMLQYAREHTDGCAWDTRVWRYAARHAHMHVMHYAVAHQAPYDMRVCEAAAAGGHTHVLQWLRYGYDIDFGLRAPMPWNSTACAAAAGGGHVATLQWSRLLAGERLCTRTTHRGTEIPVSRPQRRVNWRRCVTQWSTTRPSPDTLP